jgi:DNA-binding GntR family transcriptional regulator
MTVTDFVSERIRERILAGEYSPGAKLDQQALVTEFGASLFPVRESLRQLEAQGFVRLSPHRGAYVAEVSLTDLGEIYFVREVLEQAATEEAAPKLDRADLDAMADLVRSMERATAERDYARLLQLNRDFHFTIYEAADNALLLGMIEGLWDRSSRYRHLYTYLPSRAPRALAEHKRILRACVARDAEKAGQAVRINVRQTVKGLAAMLAHALDSSGRARKP